MKTTSNTLNQTLSIILEKEEIIKQNSIAISHIKKEFTENNTPKFSTDDFFNVTKIDVGLNYQVTSVSTTRLSQSLEYKISSSLDAIFNFDVDKTSEAYQQMLLAYHGLMFIYTLTECGKNGRAKKIGGRTHIFTEFEIESYMKKNIISSVKGA